MAIVKYIAVHQSPLKFLRYILKKEKTEGLKFATGLCCNASVNDAYMEMGISFETFSGERFYKKSLNGKGQDDKDLKKETIKLHHYIQSFKPNEITPEEAHKIGVEWARKVFGDEHQVLVTTHVDRQHIHNHFAVAAYDLNGNKWYGNKATLKKCRDISDKICKAHGLSVIENPTYHANQRYSDWLARQQKVSWKQKICDDIDELILCDDVKSVEDLAERLREKGYVVNLKKYLSVKAAKNRKAIRSYRLGDGYAIDELRYRIENKNQEMSLDDVGKYQGIQREYALCLRELQIMVYRKSENSYNATFSELQKNAELLTFMCEKKIRSVSDFENAVNSAAEKADSIKRSREMLLEKIAEREEIVTNGARFIELNKIDMPTGKQMDELIKLKPLVKFKLKSEDDIEKYQQEIDALKKELSESDSVLEAAEREKSEAAKNYRTYLQQMQSEYDFILDKLKREQEEIRQAEQEANRDKEQEQERQTVQKYYR